MEQVIDNELALKRANGNNKLADDLFAMLIKELADQPAKLEAAWSAEDMELLEEYVHKLSGSTSYCGVPILEKSADELELALKRKEPDIRPRLDLVLQEIDRVLSASQQA